MYVYLYKYTIFFYCLQSFDKYDPFPEKLNVMKIIFTLCLLKYLKVNLNILETHHLPVTRENSIFNNILGTNLVTSRDLKMEKHHYCLKGAWKFHSGEELSLLITDKFKATKDIRIL